MTWPLDIEWNEPIEGEAFGRTFVATRSGNEGMFEHGDLQTRFGLSTDTTHLRFGPSLGPLPWLIKPSPTVIIAAGTYHTLHARVPLQVDLAIRAGSQALRVLTIGPDLTRSLYGPVDGGILCWTVRNDPPDGIIAAGGEERSLLANVTIRVENRSAAPQEVTRILLPIDLVGLYFTDEGPRLSDVEMVIAADGDASLEMRAPAKGRPLEDAEGKPIAPSSRAFAFTLNYRNRTGLEYGF